jgi:NADH:ubiquinone oxidoreductase subunit H
VLAFLITGVPALIIILVILALIVLGIVSFFRMTARGARRLAGRVDDRDGPPRG